MAACPAPPMLPPHRCVWLGRHAGAPAPGQGTGLQEAPEPSTLARAPWGCMKPPAHHALSLAGRDSGWAAELVGRGQAVETRGWCSQRTLSGRGLLPGEACSQGAGTSPGSGCAHQGANLPLGGFVCRRQEGSGQHLSSPSPSLCFPQELQPVMRHGWPRLLLHTGPHSPRQVSSHGVGAQERWESELLRERPWGNSGACPGEGGKRQAPYSSVPLLRAPRAFPCPRSKCGTLPPESCFFSLICSLGSFMGKCPLLGEQGQEWGALRSSPPLPGGSRVERERGASGRVQRVCVSPPQSSWWGCCATPTSWSALGRPSSTLWGWPPAGSARQASPWSATSR